jgi:hypothetical protein
VSSSGRGVEDLFVHVCSLGSDCFATLFQVSGSSLSEQIWRDWCFQAIKGVWWMPWGRVPTKDAISGETLWGAAKKRRSRDIRMGKPGQGNAWSLPDEHIVRAEGTRGTETSKYPEEKKTDVIPPVAASERGRA